MGNNLQYVVGVNVFSNYTIDLNSFGGVAKIPEIRSNTISIKPYFLLMYSGFIA